MFTVWEQDPSRSLLVVREGQHFWVHPLTQRQLWLWRGCNNTLTLLNRTREIRFHYPFLQLEIRKARQALIGLLTAFIPANLLSLSVRL